MTATDGLRQQIIDALLPITAAIAGYRAITPMTADGPLTTDSRQTIADAVLPVVTAWAEQQARQRAAEELRAAARPGDISCTRDKLRLLDRAAALTAGDPA